MPVLFALTLFVSATLLFLVQPMVARMALPLLGGTPAVWNTCMVFFQAVLLAGYAYAHKVPAWLGPRRQYYVHGLLLTVPLFFLPIGLAREWVPPDDANPIPWLLGLLAVSVGLPFLVVATSAPLLQKWFAATGHPSARDPYFLYGASNLGSMLTLLSYPFLIEPFFTLQTQGLIWLWGYLVLAGLTLWCGWQGLPGKDEARRMKDEIEPQSSVDLTNSASSRPASSGLKPALRLGTSAGPSFRLRLHWLALAFVPSSLMLGVTTYLTTDIAAIPLLWVVPLALYLGSFILVFGRQNWIAHESWCRALPPALLCLTFLMISSGTHQLQTGVVMLVHLAVLFVTAMVCHGELARRRPAPEHLTSFYLCMSLGGVLGGMFNALLAPVIFTRVVEYPLVLVAGCLLWPRLQGSAISTENAEQPSLIRRLGFELLRPALLGGVMVFLMLGVLPSLKPGDVGERPVQFSVMPGISALVYLVPLLICFAWANRPLRFAMGLGALFVANGFCREWQDQVLHRERSFFGDLHVRIDPEGKYMQLVHGTTMHGMQSLDPAQSAEPLTYFHRTGPIGQIFAGRDRLVTPTRHVGVTGLGVGVLACYAREGQHWTYYEIDPAVCRVAREPAYFTYLQDAEKRGTHLQLILGDARLKLARAKPAEYDLLVLDAFSSDSVPVHLLTRQALELYQSKLAPKGWLVFNISNRYLNLEPVLAALAEDAGLTALVCYDEDDGIPGKNTSAWIVMARTGSELESLARLPRWRPAARAPGVSLWTDDFSNLARIFMWR